MRIPAPFSVLYSGFSVCGGEDVIVLYVPPTSGRPPLEVSVLWLPVPLSVSPLVSLPPPPSADPFVAFEDWAAVFDALLPPPPDCVVPSPLSPPLHPARPAAPATPSALSQLRRSMFLCFSSPRRAGPYDIRTISRYCYLLTL